MPRARLLSTDRETAKRNLAKIINQIHEISPDDPNITNRLSIFRLLVNAYSALLGYFKDSEVAEIEKRLNQIEEAKERLESTVKPRAIDFASLGVGIPVNAEEMREAVNV